MPGVDVVVVRWPAEAERRAQLADRNLPRLLLLNDGIEPPEAHDCLEDWVRLPASESDVRARIQGLQARGRTHLRDVPEVDAHGVVRYRDGWVAIPPVEARLAEALVLASAPWLDMTPPGAHGEPRGLANGKGEAGGAGSTGFFGGLNMDSGELITLPLVRMTHLAPNVCSIWPNGRYWCHDTHTISYRRRQMFCDCPHPTLARRCLLSPL